MLMEKLAVVACAGKHDFTGFSVHNEESCDEEGAGRVKKLSSPRSIHILIGRVPGLWTG
jgi:hypothetical protein